MEIREMKTNTFWKGEMGVEGLVSDKDQTYKVRLNIKGSQIYDYSCSCVAGNSFRGMCSHAKALWEYFQLHQEEYTAKPVSTSQQVRTMIREYTNREVARIIRENENLQLRLVPRLVFKGGETSLEFKLGRERLYVVKDLTAFVQALQTGAFVTYGKQLGFHHNISAFVPEDRPLVSFLTELVNVYEEHYEQFRKSSYVTVQGLRSLLVSRANRDRFFDLMEGRKLEIETGGSSFPVEVRMEPPRLDVKIRKAGRDGIQVSIPRELYGFPGEEHFYLGDRQRLICLDQDAAEALTVFLEQLFASGRERQVEIQERDIPLFSERVLKQILPYSRLDIQGVDLEQYRPLELKARFTFDSPGPGELTMRPELSYGDYSFVPMEDEKVPRTICRDVPGEFRISQVITKYFHYRDEAAQQLIIRDDDDAMYRLLKDGVAEFMELGQVFFTEASQKLQLLPPPRVNVGVRASGTWLELTVEADGLTQAELAKILSEYQPKKSYYRLKNGEFLQLADNGLVTVARLVGGLGLTQAQLQSGTVKLPNYRALYLDGVLKEGTGISLYRDQLFKAVVRGMKSVEDSDYEIPESLASILRGYQKTGFRWLRTLDAYGFGGILADDMGLGKTVQVIALLLDEKLKQGQAQTLIICPASLIYNWENEIRRFAPKLRTCVVAGGSGERERLLRQIAVEMEQPERDEQPEKEEQTGRTEQIAADVVITSYDLLKRDINYYENMSFRFQILDEAQYIKNPLTQSARAVKKIQAQTRFALTGTPVENRLSELWSIFDYLMPGFLFRYPKFKQMFEQPITRGDDPQAAEQLHRLIDPFLLRRLKRDVLKDLPEKLETVVYSQAQGEQKTLYAACAMEMREQLKRMDGRELAAERMQILAGLTRLRQICCDPSLCYENYKGGSAKLDTLMELVHGAIAGDHKILIFSQFTTMLDIIEKRMKKEGIVSHMLTGSTPKEERIRLAAAFQTDDVFVFLISLKAGGTGLNLTAADVVIHCDPWWNVAAQNQATDRTHRIGQTRQVTVYQLIMKDTIEENIRRLQAQKEHLVDQVIAEGTVSLSSLTREDLMEILGSSSQLEEEGRR